jgi:hypothetical protein
MNVPVHPTLIRRMSEARIKQLKAAGPVLGASLVQIAKHCGRPGCHCQTGKKHQGSYLTFKEQGKTRTVYVPVELREEVARWIAEHRRLKHLMQELSALSVARVRTHVTTRRRRAGRS